VPYARGAWAYERGRLWAIDLSGGPVPTPVQPATAAQFGEVQNASAFQLAEAMGLPGPEPVLRRFASGRRCFAARVQDQIAAYCWFSQSPECIGEMERELRITDGEAYVWDCATLPKFQRKKLYNALLGHLNHYLEAEGLRRVWIGSSVDNVPSQRAFKRAGFQPAMTALYLRLYNLSCMVILGASRAPRDLVADARHRMALPQDRSWGPFLLSYTRPAQRPACAQV
jgi:ribosomal protein S18 acetylase RimI-like enzyme